MVNVMLYAGDIGGTLYAFGLPGSATATPTSAASATNTATPTPTSAASATSTPTGAASATPTPSATSTASPTASPTPSPTAQGGACPSGWTCADIGNPPLAGSQSLSGGIWTVQGSGRDIWGPNDQFHYAWQTLSGNGSVSARVSSLSGGDPYWAKAGVMLRASSSANAPFFAIEMTPANGVVVQYRASAGANAVALASTAGSAPVYVQVTRTGTAYAAATSPDGVTWTPLGSSVTLSNLGATPLAGLAVTSHDVTLLTTATFDQVIM